MTGTAIPPGPGTDGASAPAGQPGVAFPGQGTKRAETLAAVATHRDHPLVAEMLDRLGAADESGLDLDDTRVSQPVVYATGIAAADALGLDPAAVPATLGHSLGELTALAFAGVLDPFDGLTLALRRGEICRAQQDRRPGAMVAVMGVDSTGVEWIRRQAIGRGGGVLELAGLNGARQTVLSGDTETVRRAVEVAGEVEALAEVLPIGGSFHSPLMLEAIPVWRAAVEGMEFRPPRTTVFSSIDARPHDVPAELAELLVRALLLPVRWRETVLATKAYGVERLWDAGPGETLHKLGRRDRAISFGPAPVGLVAAGDPR